MRRKLAGLMGILTAAALALGAGTAAELSTADGRSASHQVIAGDEGPNAP